ncbi:MAG: response regulator transcription factor [Azonexus sp.]|nr:response regulator transcription factor [Azonexus sp.]
MIRILIVDDHAIVGAGLKQFLTNIGGFEIAGQARTGAEALALVRAGSWDLLLLDIGLPDINGIEVLKIIKREQPELPVLVFSMYAEDDYAMAALEAGALGYLPKDSAPEEILAAIRRASSCERYLSPALANKLLNGSVHRVRKLPHESLSTREFDVMQMLSKGLPLTEIAERLHLSPKTISTYRARVLEKMDFSNNSDITRYMMHHKLGQ